MTAEEILRKLTLEEKISLCSGVNNWETDDLSRFGLPALFMSDGPHGLRKQAEGQVTLNESVPATCFPAECLSACSWDVELLEEEGAQIGREAISYGVGAVLGPGVCMKRNPLCGRNFEYFSEDPHLAGKLASGFVRGMERQGITACVKHFAANNQEFFRFLSSSRMDERTLREIYLTAFELAVRESHPGMVMCAYNQLDNVPCASNHRLLTSILRDEWGFDGVVVSDWGAMHNREDSFRAGLDLAMPGGSAFGEAEAAEAVRNGTLSVEDVDRSALRILGLMLKESWLSEREDMPKLDVEAGDRLAQKVAEGSVVLLKNEESILPVRKDAKIALIGDMAQNPRYQGAGSSHINPTRLCSLKDALPGATCAQGCLSDGTTTRALLEEAADAARSADVAIVCAGLPGSCESEGFDRQSMQMPPGHNELIETVRHANPNTVVVLSSGSPVETPWAPDVRGMLYAGLGGQAGARAVARILLGEVCPSGRLAESWPMQYADCPSAPFYDGEFVDAEYREGVFMGYRYYDSANVPVRFPFGFGLSYTTFAFSELDVKDNVARVTVTNTGNVAGAEVVQMYVEPPRGALARPVRELKGFAKIFLQPGESACVTLPLDKRSFAVWSDGWKVPGGEYTIHVGNLSATLKKAGEDVGAPDWQAGSWQETFEGVPTHEDLEKMCGCTFAERKVEPGSLTMDNTLEDLARYSDAAKRVYDAVVNGARRMYPDSGSGNNPELRMMISSLVQIPLSSVVISLGQKDDFYQTLLRVANGENVPGFDVVLSEQLRQMREA